MVTYEAVALYRELLDRATGDRHLPPLARALTNLSACLSRAGRGPAALGAAGQAVAIYRELVRAAPQSCTRPNSPPPITTGASAARRSASHVAASASATDRPDSAGGLSRRPYGSAAVATFCCCGTAGPPPTPTARWPAARRSSSTTPAGPRPRRSASGCARCRWRRW